MTTPPNERRRRRGLPLLITGAVLAGAIAGGVVVSQLNNPDTPTEPTTTTTAEPTTATTAPLGSGYTVEAGAGGTRVANADGKTPMGYPSTCEGAIAAATNYAAMLESSDAASMTPEGIATFNALIDEISPGAIPGAGMWQDQVKERHAKAAELYTTVSPLLGTAIPEVGAFRVVSCTPERAAEIDVLYGGELRLDGVEGVDRYYITKRVQLTWMNDWSPRDVGDMPDPVEKSGYISPDEFSRSLRDAFLSGDPSKWQEYSNVPF